MRKKLLPQVILAELSSLTSTVTSSAGSSRMMVASFRAGRVVLPGRETSSASMRQLTTTSRSVVVRRSSFPSASSRTFDRIGSVARLLTTFCTCWRPSTNFSLVMRNFMGR